MLRSRSIFSQVRGGISLNMQILPFFYCFFHLRRSDSLIMVLLSVPPIQSRKVKSRSTENGNRILTQGNYGGNLVFRVTTRCAYIPIMQIPISNIQTRDICLVEV